MLITTSYFTHTYKYRNMAIIACSSIAVIICWVIRWERQDIESLKHQSHLSITNDASCTSVLTCVEPSLRDI